MLLDCDIHPGQQPGIMEKRHSCFVRCIFIVGRNKAARQAQGQVCTAAQGDAFIQVNGLHNHVKVMVAVWQQSSHI